MATFRCSALARPFSPARLSALLHHDLTQNSAASVYEVYTATQWRGVLGAGRLKYLVTRNPSTRTTHARLTNGPATHGDLRLSNELVVGAGMAQWSTTHGCVELTGESAGLITFPHIVHPNLTMGGTYAIAEHSGLLAVGQALAPRIPCHLTPCSDLPLYLDLAGVLVVEALPNMVTLQSMLGFFDVARPRAVMLSTAAAVSLATNSPAFGTAGVQLKRWTSSLPM